MSDYSGLAVFVTCNGIAVAEGLDGDDLKSSRAEVPFIKFVIFCLIHQKNIVNDFDSLLLKPARAEIFYKILQIK